jgi:hypothetical protein
MVWLAICSRKSRRASLKFKAFATDLLILPLWQVALVREQTGAQALGEKTLVSDSLDRCRRAAADTGARTPKVGPARSSASELHSPFVASGSEIDFKF